MTNTLTDSITAHLDDMGDRALSDRAEQQVDGYRAWLDTGDDLPALAVELGLLDQDRPAALAVVRKASAEALFVISGRVAR